MLISLRKRAAWLLALALLGTVAAWFLPLAPAVWGLLSAGWMLLLIGYVAGSSWRRHRDDMVFPAQPGGASQQNSGHS
ncbi:hypothetical protein DKM44_12285 [Deinococcus irradiatisoli]|uniref:Uncharacterized protein n=1 Tax=Deinococcus irradiatisoli TaxID=2202254 RepID=A0A2Z3JFW8_9DEIO|nr:hypothetical protein DKM44_12285 [Deinococcus irradiatisoli]